MRLPSMGEIKAFGKFAGERGAGEPPTTMRYAKTWTDKGPHESAGAAQRRLRQMARAKARNDVRGV